MTDMSTSHRAAAVACLAAMMATASAFVPTAVRPASGVQSTTSRRMAMSKTSIAQGWGPAQHRRRVMTSLHMSAVAEEQAVDTKAEPEKFEFQAEVSRVMDIIINSLYSNRDVFLRELLSNAADACDKRRFLSIQEGEKVEQRIQVKADKDASTLVIQDTGVGMTKEELINNLGRIAQSGTAKFMEALGKGDADVSLIGQFGVGFYSSFLVADKVTVITKSFQGENPKQWRWESEAGKSYTVAEDEGEPLEKGSTKIILHLKEDAEEYLDDFKLKELCRKYSEFVSFPIQIWSEVTKYEEVPDEKAEVKEGEKPKTKTVTKTNFEWDTVNKMKPIWMRSPKDVTDKEYEEFYKGTFKAWDEPAAHTHFALEGQVEFRAMLFVPGAVPYELSRNMFDDQSRNVRLYVKRVFINDKFEELLPRWLMFLRGLVDSEDLPLNVGREILQRSKMLTVINKRLVRKSIDMFKGIMQDEAKYTTFYNNFGKYLKVGVIEDDDNKDEIAKLCKWWTSRSTSGMVFLDEYVKEMKEGQKAIYYVTGDSRAAAEMSPALEKAKKMGYEVLFMTEPLDELAIQAVGKYDGKDLVDLGKEGVELEDDETAKKAKEEKSSKLEEFRTWIKTTLGNKVKKVEVSNRLVDSVATLVQGTYGMSPTMQRYMKAQAVALGQSDQQGQFGMDQMNQAVLEINADHPVVRQLESKFKSAPDSEDTKALAMLVYDIAALTAGYTIDDPAQFAKRVTGMLMERAGAEGGASEPVPEASSSQEAPYEGAYTSEDNVSEVQPKPDLEDKIADAEIVTPQSGI